MNDKTWMAGKLGVSALARRFGAVAGNIANVNTPGYKKKEVNFEENLREALDTRKSSLRLKLNTTNEDHIGPSAQKNGPENFQVEEVTDPEGIYRLDGNNVDPEIEMAKLAETKMAYNGILRMMAKRANMIKTAMGGR